MPESAPSDFRYGSEDEAVHYAAFAEEVWQETPGALEWLAGSVPTPAPPAGAVYQLRVVLLGSQPRIWRRLQVDAGTTLAELHDILQYAIGWHDEHLHQFQIAGVTYSPDPQSVTWTREVVDESRAELRSALPYPKAIGVYEYDFGDSWTHEILVERFLEPDPEVQYPVCIAGKRLGPPEDSGGVWRYNELVRAARDAEHPEHEYALEWLDEDFDPEALNLDDVNARLDVFR
jgi:hypothetical protein